jgi:thymidylate synthase (FAD)
MKGIKMPKFERVEDKWKHLREDLYGNVEPEVTLEAATIPLETIRGAGGPYSDAIIVDMWPEIEQLPALAAGVSYGSKKKLESDTERTIKLNKKLIELKHLTPLEAIQYNIHISGISKACGAQLSRYRHTGHISASLRYQEGQPLFVYPMLDYIKDEHTIKTRLYNIETAYKESYKMYQHLRKDFPDNPEFGNDLYSIKKEDARMCLPVSYATERIMWVNARELRHIFAERLKSDAQWEIRRLCWMIYDLITPLTPSLFEDILND